MFFKGKQLFNLKSAKKKKKKKNGDVSIHLLLSLQTMSFLKRSPLGEEINKLDINIVPSQLFPFKNW